MAQSINRFGREILLRPGAELLSPHLRTAQNLLVMGGDPLVGGGPRSEAFERSLGMLVPETREEAIARGNARAEERFLAAANAAGMTGAGETNRAQMDMRQDAMNRLLGLRTMAQGGGGGRAPREPKPKKPAKPRVGWVNPKNRMPQPEPEAPARKTVDPRMVALQRALDAARTTDRDIRERQADIRAQGSALSRLGMGGTFGMRGLTERPGGAPKPRFRNASDAFFQTLFAEQTKNARRRTETVIAKEALQAFQAGDEGRAAALYDEVAKMQVNKMGLPSGGSRRAMTKHMDRTARATLTHLGEGNDTVKQKFLQANLSIRELERVRDLAADGWSGDEINGWIRANTNYGKRHSQAEAAAMEQKAAKEMNEASLLQIFAAMMNKMGAQ